MHFSRFIVLSHLSCGTHSLVVVELFVWPVTTCLHGIISWLCVGSLLNDKLDSMSHTIMFILNLIVVVIWCSLATHLHVFFPSMVCVSRQHWPCGYYTCLKVIILIFFNSPLRQWTIFFTWWIISINAKVVCTKKFLCDFFYDWSIAFCIDVFVMESQLPPFLSFLSVVTI